MKRLAVLLVIFFLVFVSYAHAKRYRFVSIEGLVEQEVGHIILPEIYRRAGLEMTVIALPARRAQTLATTGLRDGEIMRIWSYGEQNPTVVRVPTPYYSLETAVFVRAGSDITVTSKEDLKNYRIAKVRGVKHTNNITNDVDPSQLVDVNDTASAMRMLRYGRVDVVLTNRSDGLQLLGDKNPDIVCLPDSLAVLPLYQYLHVSNRELVESIDNVIRTMKESGELEQLIDAAEKEVAAKRHMKNNMLE